MNLHRQETQKTIDAIHNYLSPEISVPGLIEETQSLLGNVRQSLVRIGRNLYFLRKTGAYEKFGEWAHEQFDISASMTSKLMSEYENWVVKMGFTVEEIEHIDHEKLYGYIPLLEGKTKEQALAEVQTWSRKDIKEEKQEKAPCFHPRIEKMCVECWTVVPEHGD